jgi:hypothetical protein
VARELRYRNGVCRWGAFYVDVPRTHTVVEAHEATVYSLRPEQVHQHFASLVDGAVAASEAAVTGYVRMHIQRQLAAARATIAEYGERCAGDAWPRRLGPAASAAGGSSVPLLRHMGQGSTGLGQNPAGTTAAAG